jgi:UDP-N-acetylmuramate dehydrogenase
VRAVSVTLAPLATKLRFGAPLAPHFSLGLGGPARVFVRVENEAELRAALRYAEQATLQTLILGGGSNLVCGDAGFDGLVIQIGLRGLEWEVSDGPTRRVVVAAGEPWDGFVQACCERNLQGVECLSGIPGTVGASPIQNIGAYGQEVAETISEVRCLDRHTGTVVDLPAEACGFAYRQSRFKTSDAERFVVLRVTFTLFTGRAPKLAYPELRDALDAQGAASPTLLEVRDCVLKTRRGKSMLQDPADPNGRNCGSFFLNPILTEADYTALSERAGSAPPRYSAAAGHVKVPAAWLIERAGFARGQRSGNVGISTKHSLCLVAHEGATSRELLLFARAIRDGVAARLGVNLEQEPGLVGVAV